MDGTPLEMLGVPIEWGPFWLWWLDWCLYAYGHNLLWWLVLGGVGAWVLRSWRLMLIPIVGWLLFCFIKQGWALG